MRKSLSILVVVMCLPVALRAQTSAPADTVADRAAEALSMAREGNTKGALEIYEGLVEQEPGNMALIRDYAVVLGWADKYHEAIPVIRKVREAAPEQPDWALRDFARIYLFGDALDDALSTLNELIARGDSTEQTLLRRALALRWLGRNGESQEAYRRVTALYPTSADGIAGLAYSLADEGSLSEALSGLELYRRGSSANATPVLRARIRILNWMGRHFEAQRLIATLPEELQNDREILEDRIAASRWGGNPSGAMRDADRLVNLFPTVASRNISRDLRTEYGHSATPEFRFSKDVDGLLDRALGQTVAFHITPAHTIRAGYQYRWLEFAGEERTLVRYDVGWNGNIGRRLSFFTTLSNVDYRFAGVDRKLIGDGSAEIAVSDTVRLTFAGGSVVMDAFQALDSQVTGNFGFAHVSFTPNPTNRVQARYGRFMFSDDVARDRTDFEYTRTLLSESGVKFRAGWRSNLMWHDTQTVDFFSPLAFQSHLAIAQSDGPITKWLEYSGEIGAGWQIEQGSSTLHPLQFSGSLVIHPTRHWRTTLSAGRSTSSVDRVIPGQYIYSRWTAAANMEFRIP